MKKSLIILLAFLLISNVDYLKNAENQYSLLELYDISYLPCFENITCTGICYDNIEKVWYIADAGKMKEDSYIDKIKYKIFDEKPNFNAKIYKLSQDFSKVLSVIECYKNNYELKDIQGLSFDNINNSLWYVSPNENLVRNITKDGEKITEIFVSNPSGIAYDNRNNTLWCLTKEKLFNMSTDGEILKSFDVKINGQDQIFVDKKHNLIYLTAGTNYDRNQFLFVFSIDKGKIIKTYELEGSFAVEGISIIDSKIIIANDGFYHNAKIPKNYIAIYEGI